jgi:RimJ/RimL family protein N-acetyltransferase
VSEPPPPAVADRAHGFPAIRARPGRVDPVQLHDEVITLAPLRLDDAGPHLAGEDAELVRWLNDGPGTPHSVEAYLRRAIDQWAAGGPKLSFGIRVDQGRLLAGTLDIDLALPSLLPREANLAYGLYPAWRGRGLATRAVRLACSYLRERGDIDRAVIRTDPRNRASSAVAERAGFTALATHGDPMEVRSSEISAGPGRA